MYGLKNRSGITTNSQNAPRSEPEPSIREALAELDTSHLPWHLRSEIHALDCQWNTSREAEEWVVNACIEAQRGDLLEKLVNRYGVTRITGVRTGVGIVADVLRRCPSLTQIEFSDAAILDDEAASLVEALQERRNLTDLALRGCTMSNQALQDVCDVLPEIHRLNVLCIEARHGGTWLGALGAAVACHPTLAVLDLQVLNLDGSTAAALGNALRASRSLTTLQFHATSAASITSLLQGLAASDEPVRASDLLRSPPRLAHFDLRAHGLFGDAFCAQLCELIRTRRELGSLRVRSGIQATAQAVHALCSAIQDSSMKIDFAAEEVPASLAQLSRLRPYQQMLVQESAVRAAVRALLHGAEPWSGLFEDLAMLVEAAVIGRGSHRELWSLRGVLGVCKILNKQEVRKAAVDARSEALCKTFADERRRHGRSRHADVEAIAHFWRLKLSGVELREADALRLREWRSALTRAHTSSPDRRSFDAKLEAKGKKRVVEHLDLVQQLMDSGDDDLAAFALASAQQVLKEYQFDDEGRAGELSRRLTLGEMRYQRRNASAHLARSMIAIMFVLLTADHYFDVAMRQLFDQDRAYGVGPPRSLEAAQDQRKFASGWTILPLVAVIVVIYMIKVEWVDAITRKLRLP